jgi:Response regulators consisting of a CheY-like receiver domain and a winged-helix DNA-binding domain
MKAIQRILIIDDEAAIRKLLRVSLQNHGYQIEEAVSGTEALAKAISFRPELVILDLGLPDQDGLSVLKRLREWSKTPVIVLTVRDSEQDKIQLLDAGAEDYLTKPFSVPELLARIRVVERHILPSDQKSPVMEFGPLEIDLAARTVKVKGALIRLTATEYDILRLFVENAGKVVTHRQILKQIWGPNAVEHTQYLRVYVGHLRKKIEADPETPSLIITEPGVGYRFWFK